MSTLDRRRLAALVENSEAAAYADMFRAAPPALGLDLEVTRACTVLQAPRFDVLVLNRVLGLGLVSPTSERMIGALVERFRAAGSRNFGIQLSPEAQPARAPQWLTASGLQVRDAWTKVYRAATTPAAIGTDLRIERAASSQADLFGALACQGFGMPAVLSPLMAATVGRRGWHHYIAWSGDQPAAVGAMFVQGEVGWLGVAATLPTFRRRGAQGALMTRRIQDGAALGCRWFVTETGQDTPEKPNASYRNMRRLGFVDAYHRPNYMNPKFLNP